MSAFKIVGLTIMGLTDTRTATESIATAIAKHTGVTVTMATRAAVTKPAAHRGSPGSFSAAPTAPASTPCGSRLQCLSGGLSFWLGHWLGLGLKCRLLNRRLDLRPRAVELDIQS
jgi:hypothetical protein